MRARVRFSALPEGRGSKTRRENALSIFSTLLPARTASTSSCFEPEPKTTSAPKARAASGSVCGQQPHMTTRASGDFDERLRIVCLDLRTASAVTAQVFTIIASQPSALSDISQPLSRSIEATACDSY